MELSGGMRTRPPALKWLPEKFSCPRCGGGIKKVTNGYHCKNNDWSLVIREGDVKWWNKVLLFINGYKTIGGFLIWGAGSIFRIPWLVGVGQAISAGGGVHKAVKLAGKVKNKNRENSIVKLIIEFIIKLIDVLKKWR